MAEIAASGRALTGLTEEMKDYFITEDLLKHIFFKTRQDVKVLERDSSYDTGDIVYTEKIPDGYKMVCIKTGISGMQESDTIHVPRAQHIYGMVLFEEGNKQGQWFRIDKNQNIVSFNSEHGTWANIKTISNSNGEFIEIPITYVKNEKFTDGPFIGRNCWWIADGPEDGFHVHPCFIGKDGQPHNLQIASWLTSKNSNKPQSIDKGTGANKYWNNVLYDDINTSSSLLNVGEENGYRAYNIYDHHFLSRMMLTEFGTSNVQDQTIDGVSWNGNNRINYHGIHDIFGMNAINCWIDGITITNNTYHILKNNGSGEIIDTEIEHPNSSNIFPENCLLTTGNGFDFGDIFIASNNNSIEKNGSFADKQIILEAGTENAPLITWSESSINGAFSLSFSDTATTSTLNTWRIVKCS